MNLLVKVQKNSHGIEKIPMVPGSYLGLSGEPAGLLNFVLAGVQVKPFVFKYLDR